MIESIPYLRTTPCRHTLITKLFGRINFGTEKCPKFFPSEQKRSRNILPSEHTMNIYVNVQITVTTILIFYNNPQQGRLIITLATVTPFARITSKMKCTAA